MLKCPIFRAVARWGIVIGEGSGGRRGAEGLKKIVLDTIERISKRQIHPCETVEQARDRLAKENA